jgi:Restriction endonuclease
VKLNLKQSKAITELSTTLYNFLPGQPHPYADQSISFAGVAKDLQLAALWPGGSKLPALTHLFTAVLEQRPQRFCDLITAVVQRGLTYASGKGRPITREQIEGINTALIVLGFKIPELWDRLFLDSLPSAQQPSADDRVFPFHDLRGLLENVMTLSGQDRGYEFERFLTKMFEAFDLAPRMAFRIVGEQIDGSFSFDGETYLLEATWRNDKVGEEELNSFSGKVIGKAQWSRGLHISYAGYTGDGLEAFARGKAVRIVCMDGLDLSELLRRELALTAVLARKVRRAAETNDAFVPLRDLFP